MWVPTQKRIKFTPVKPPEDANWPLFRFSEEPFAKFWQRKTQKDLNKVWYDDKLFFAANMFRIGKKKKAVKGYYYRLTYDGLLMYFKKVNASIDW
jgi:hypothetical protein